MVLYPMTRHINGVALNDRLIDGVESNEINRCIHGVSKDKQTYLHMVLYPTTKRPKYGVVSNDRPTDLYMVL